MASSWIQVDTDLPNKPEVINVAVDCGLTPRETWSAILELWFWCDKNMPPNGRLPLASMAALIALFGMDEAFWEAVKKQGWLGQDAKGFFIPGHRKRFGESTKKRQLTNQRVARHRERKKSVTSVTHVTRYSNDDALTRRDETRRDESRKENIRSSTSTKTDVGDLKYSELGTGTDWEHAAYAVQKACATLDLESPSRLSAADKSLLFKGFAILGEGGFADAIEGTRIVYAKTGAGRPKCSKCAYLTGIFQEKVGGKEALRLRMARIAVPADVGDGPASIGSVMAGITGRGESNG